MRGDFKAAPGFPTLVVTAEYWMLALLSGLAADAVPGGHGVGRPPRPPSGGGGPRTPVAPGSGGHADEQP
ncbi:hypothetical protein, partial [Kitasatospora sp. NPDC057595]|uniref:hypothetical protein n=1 Tax=Kitasatospora sp. NPDC057595 TaxID=3346177 RepID=UPI00369727FD